MGPNGGRGINSRPLKQRLKQVSAVCADDTETHRHQSDVNGNASLVELDVATWKRSTDQRRSDSALAASDDQAAVSNKSSVNDASRTDSAVKPLDTVKTVQKAVDKCLNDVCRVSSLGSIQSSLRVNVSQTSAEICFDQNANVRDSVLGGRRHRPGGPAHTQSTDALSEHPRRSLAGLKRKSSTSKSACVQ